jgi:NAD(P)H-hydrate repair Nnr-like enzyme with NAD(P)H-hydrate dehydratase domain
VLTPHAGEFARLRAGSGHDPSSDGDLARDDEARVRAASSAAVQWRQVVVLKGARTVVAAPDGAAGVAPFENPAMASGGTGDVLAGTIGALLAQGLVAFDAARLCIPPRPCRQAAWSAWATPSVGDLLTPSRPPAAPRRGRRAPGRRTRIGFHDR